jgi:hypothetical protein
LKRQIASKLYWLTITNILVKRFWFVREIAMSVASRAPLPFPPAACSYHDPVLVDHATGLVDRAALRRELHNRATGAPAWPHRELLAYLMQKVRLQRRFALAAIARRAEDKARADQTRAALETQAYEIAARHGFDTAALRFQRDRYQFGTLAGTLRAPHMRALYRRALEIAIERAATAFAQAAE